MKIYFLAKRYPNGVDINSCYFVQQLVWTLADMGVDCSVICPVPVNKKAAYRKLPEKTCEMTEKGSRVMLYYPRCYGFGEKLLGNVCMRLTAESYFRACRRVIDIIGVPDAVYGHFIVPPGLAAARLGRIYDIPAFFAYGEASPDEIYRYGKRAVENILSSVAGVVAVSTKSCDELAGTGVIGRDKIQVFPNGIRPERFYPREKTMARRKFGFDENAFIVSFVGAFHTRKGAHRLEQAMENVPGAYAAYAGKGRLKPKSACTIWAGPVENEDMPLFLSASDVFVLPTLNEGCSNSIIEAMACGLPVISSDRSFNDDILDDSCSLRIDPESPQQISDAINRLRDNPELLKKLSEGSIAKAGQLSLEKRAENILGFINGRMKGE